MPLIRLMNFWAFYPCKGQGSSVTYCEFVGKIDLICKFVTVALTFSMLSVSVPFLLYFLINYYILDSREESFLLLFPVKFVSLNIKG